MLRAVKWAWNWYINLSAIQQLEVSLGAPTVSALVLGAIAFATQSPETSIAIIASIWALITAGVVVLFAREHFWKPQPLDVVVQVGSYTASPTALGAGIREWIVRLGDILLVSREPKRLDLQPLLWIKARHGGYRSLRPSIQCRSGITTVRTEVGEPQHLPVEIGLSSDGAPQRGHIDFVGLYAEDEWGMKALESVELELRDIRTGRSLRIPLNPRSEPRT